MEIRYLSEIQFVVSFSIEYTYRKKCAANRVVLSIVLVYSFT
ncbi:unnamed protein product [Callosobruchus maculatus]|uniref:Uncharacterized protein n=1 Tax=Callosobruchus maculatus TaxID=64391 RepID=A0A653DAH7_CALMS|nr:unnamed protein product [Callosobruchus maculatus]